MATVKKSISDIEYYQGEHAIAGIRFRSAREAMGISAWGMNVLELDADCDGYPEHDHAHDGQEEIYLVLEGSIILTESGVEHTLIRGDMVRVGPETLRKFVTRDEPATILALGGTPRQAYGQDPRLSPS
jgi:uncharacterized cupin superfamily protein